MVGPSAKLAKRLRARSHLDSNTLSFASVSQRLRGLWGAQNKSTRLLLGVVGGALVAGLAIFGLMRMRGPDYGVLFANLAPEDASAVVTKLKDAKIPYQLSNGGTTISVPQESVYEERVLLAGDGVVKGGGSGYELFDKMNFGMTDFQEKIAKQRATEGELQRTIAGLTAVESARVHIASPEASLYSSVQQPTTASVAIKTKPGMSLGPTEVRGITQLVANSVEGLKPDNVTIVNQDGNVLVPSASDQNDPALAAQAGALKLTQEQLLAKQRYETNLQQNIQGLLDTVIGPHRSAVRVATDMNFDANETESKTYAPQGTILSQQNEKEAYTGTQPKGAGAGGVPATTSNSVPTYQSSTGGAAGNYKKSKSTINYDVTEQNAKHVDAPGKLTRESIAVLVNVPAAVPAAAAAATGTATAAAGAAKAAVPAVAPYVLTPDDIVKIKNVVAAASGLDPTRGDQISVESIPFAPVAEIPVDKVQTVMGLPLAPVIAVVGVLLLALVGFLAMKMRKPKAAAGSGNAPELPSFDSSLAEQLPSFESHPMLEGAPNLAAPIRSAADLTREQMIEYVTSVANESPDSIAKLVKLWLAE
jgi:flagellar M-ring protein FliF